MTDTHPNVSARGLAPQSRVNADDIAPLTLRYPGGFLARIPAEKRPLMEQAAQETGLKVLLNDAEPMVVNGRIVFKDVLEVWHTADGETASVPANDPKALFERYNTLLIDALVRAGGAVPGGRAAMWRFLERVNKAVSALGGIRFCDQPGCWERNLTRCGLSDEDGGEYVWHYCFEHARENGFCWGCGGFWSGCEDFDFSPSGLCTNCRDDPDYDEFIDDDDYYPSSYPWDHHTYDELDHIRI